MATLRRSLLLKGCGRLFQDGVPTGLSLLTLFGGGLRLRKYGDTNNRSQASLQGPKWMSSVTQDSSVPCARNCSHTAPFCHFLLLIPVTYQVWLGGLFSFKKWSLEAKAMITCSTWYIFFSFNFSLHTINWIIKFHSEVFLQLHSIWRSYTG